MRYPGGKSGSGVYHRLINLMPPHLVYCEPFLGGGAVMRLKRPAPYNVGVDLDADVIAGWLASSGDRSLAETQSRPAEAAKTPLLQPDLVAAALLQPNLVAASRNAASGRAASSGRRGTAEAPLKDSGCDGNFAAGGPRFRFLRGDGLTFLASYPFQPMDLIYCDPPYLMETRSSGRLYKHEMSDAQHAELLATILDLPCRVMISGYWSEMYADALQGWRSINFEAMTRGGMATEWLWFNFPEPDELHDWRFLGKDNRERTNFRRQKERWIARLRRMPVLKKRALLAAITEVALPRHRPPPV